MDVFRIARCSYIRDLHGTGARMYGGRWNSKGQAVLYTAGSRSLAALETIVHVPQKNMTSGFCIMKIQVPPTIRVKTLKSKELPDDWKGVAISPKLQRLGDQWLQQKETPILKVPSVIVPEEYNYLINPLHPDFSQIKSRKPKTFIFDERMSGR